MAVSTTQSIWRSGGGDQTRTAYCGSGVMVAQFYIPDANLSANVVVSSAVGAPQLFLPQGAVVTSVVVNDAGTGNINIGFQAVNNANTSATAIASNLAPSAGTTAINGSTVPGTALTDLGYIISSKQSAASGTVGGYLTYFVVDPLVGQQNV